MNDEDFMLTTVDNPYSPFTQWGEWYSWDVAHGYNTSSLLARLCVSSSNFPNTLSVMDEKQAAQQIIDTDFTGKYRIIKENEEIPYLSEKI